MIVAVTFLYLIVALVLIGIGIAFGLAGCAALALLTGFGVVSSSVIVGITTKRPEAGWKAFLLQAGVLAGIPAGIVALYLGRALFAVIGDDWGWIATGAGIGAFAGAGAALCLEFISRRAFALGKIMLARTGLRGADQRGLPETRRAGE